MQSLKKNDVINNLDFEGYSVSYSIENQNILFFFEYQSILWRYNAMTLKCFHKLDHVTGKHNTG